MFMSVTIDLPIMLICVGQVIACGQSGASGRSVTRPAITALKSEQGTVQHQYNVGTISDNQPKTINYELASSE